MRVFHVIEEITKKNSSIVSISKIYTKNKNLKGSLIISPKNKSEINVKNKKKFKIIKNFFNFESDIFVFLKKKKPDVIHIHGLWRPIHLYFAIISKIMNLPIIVQPHGMLLDEAMRSRSKFNYFLKRSMLIIYKIFFKNIFFIAVTLDEKKSINRYFKNNFIKIIENPFEVYNQLDKNKKKQIVYFGRISKHKNLDLIIKSFIRANLDNEWKLLIYGIEDDENYKKYLKKLIKQNDYKKKIILKKPIFNLEKKFSKISESALNILMSKSEILSLSVLEALSVGTRSLVNQKIRYPKAISNLIFFSKPTETDISLCLNKIINEKKIETISQQNLKKKFKDFYNKKNIEEKYLKYLRFSKFNHVKNKDKISLPIIAAINGMNIFISAFILTLSGIVNPLAAAEIGIIEGTVLYLTQIFSSNNRTQLLTETNKSFYYEYVFNRIIISLVILIVFRLFLTDIDFIEFDFHFWLICVLLTSWINELIFTRLEKDNFQFFLTFFIFFQAIFYLSCTYSVLNEFKYFNIILQIFLSVHLLYIIFFVRFSILLKTKFNFTTLLKNKFSFLSTFFNTFSILVWRYSFIFFTNKEISGIFFAIFSIASFPGTLINNILGQTILRDVKFRDIIVKYEIKGYLSFFLIIFASYIFLNSYNFNFNKIYLDGLFFSLCGTIIMFASIRLRHLALYSFRDRQNLVFKRDIIYSVIILPYVIILFNILNLNGIVYAYFLSAITSYIVYNRSYD